MVHGDVDKIWEALQRDRFSLLVMAVGESSLELCRRVRSEERFGDVEILVFAGGDEAVRIAEEEPGGETLATLDAFVEAGAGDFVYLPAPPPLLDLRLRLAERRLRGRALAHSPAAASTPAQAKLEKTLRRAVDQWQFDVLYQPVVDLETDRIAGFEALVRWLHPERGVVLPNEFINLAEETGLITTLGSRVLAEACLQMREWQDRLRSQPYFVSVNLSNRQLAQPRLVEQVARVLEESGLPGSSLILELTELAVLEQADVILPTLERLKALGVRLALDDFGTGPSSLSVLHRFAFDIVKIDHGFIGNVGIDPESDELVEGIMALCQWRQLATVAEGVEQESQRQRLRELGCSYAQGYFFAAPGSVEEAEKWLVGSRRRGTAGGIRL